MKKGITFFLLVFHIAFLSTAQPNHVADSLEHVLSRFGQDTNRINLLNKIARQYRSTNIIKARICLNESLQLAKKLDFIPGLAEANNVLAITYDYEGNYNQALICFNRAMAVAGRSADKGKLARLMDNTGSLYMRMGNYDSALSILNRSLQIKRKMRNDMGMAFTYEQIGTVYTTQGDYKQALDYTLRSMRIVEEGNDKAQLGMSYIHVAMVYMQLANYTEALAYFARALPVERETGNTEGLLGIYINRSDIYVNTGQYRKALQDNDSALAILINGDNAAALISCYANAGTIYKMMGDIGTALSYYKQALAVAIKIGDTYNQATIYTSLGELAGKEKQYQASLAYLKQGNILASQLNAREYLKENYLAYASVYTQMGNYKNAYASRLRYETIRDSMVNEDNNKQIAEMRTKYETAKKEKEIVILNNQKKEQALNIARQQLLIQKRNFELAGVCTTLVLCIVIAVLVYNRNRERQKAILDKAMADQERIRIQTVLETEQRERVRIAQDLHDELGSGISKLMLCHGHVKKAVSNNDALNATFTTIDKTIDMLAGNMNDLIWSLQVEDATVDVLFAKMREFASDFFDESPIEPQFEMTTDKPERPLSKQMLRDVFLVYKEALNNAMKYSGGDKIFIKASADENRLQVRIYDNGKGLGNGQAGSGNGIVNMRNRIAKHQGIFDISNAERGTTVSYTLGIS